MRDQSGRLLYLKKNIENLSREMEILHFSKADIEKTMVEKSRLCGISIIYYKRYEISGVFSGSYKNWEIITKDYPVTNYYPWKDLMFLSAILTQDGNITMEVSYLFLGETRNIYDGEKITAETDIV